MSVIFNFRNAFLFPISSFDSALKLPDLPSSSFPHTPWYYRAPANTLFQTSHYLHISHLGNFFLSKQFGPLPFPYLPKIFSHQTTTPGLYKHCTSISRFRTLIMCTCNHLLIFLLKAKPSARYGKLAIWRNADILLPRCFRSVGGGPDLSPFD